MKKELLTKDFELVPFGKETVMGAKHHKRLIKNNRRIHAERRCAADRRQVVRFEKQRRAATNERRAADRRGNYLGKYGH